MQCKKCKRWYLSRLGDNLAPRTIWHLGQFGTEDNLAPGQFGTKSVKEDNLAPRTIWHRNEKGTIWHRHEKGTIWHRSVKGTIWHRNEKRTIWHQDNLAPQWKRDNLAPGCYQNKKCNFKMREKYFVKWKRNTLSNLSQPSARRAHRHPPTVISPPNVGRIYPIQIYLSYWHMFPNPAPEGRTDNLQL